jgi:hypothetical protein
MPEILRKPPYVAGCGEDLLDASGRERLLIGPTTGLVTCPDFDVRRRIGVWKDVGNEPLCNYVWGFSGMLDMYYIFPQTYIYTNNVDIYIYKKLKLLSSVYVQKTFTI